MRATLPPNWDKLLTPELSRSARLVQHPSDQQLGLSIWEAHRLLRTLASELLMKLLYRDRTDWFESERRRVNRSSR